MTFLSIAAVTAGLTLLVTLITNVNFLVKFIVNCWPGIDTKNVVITIVEPGILDYLNGAIFTDFHIEPKNLSRYAKCEMEIVSARVIGQAPAQGSDLLELGELTRLTIEPGDTGRRLGLKWKGKQWSVGSHKITAELRVRCGYWGAWKARLIEKELRVWRDRPIFVLEEISQFDIVDGKIPYLVKVKVSIGKNEPNGIRCASQLSGEVADLRVGTSTLVDPRNVSFNKTLANMSFTTGQLGAFKDIYLDFLLLASGQLGEGLFAHGECYSR